MVFYNGNIKAVRITDEGAPYSTCDDQYERKLQSSGDFLNKGKKSLGEKKIERT